MRMGSSPPKAGDEHANKTKSSERVVILFIFRRFNGLRAFRRTIKNINNKIRILLANGNVMHSRLLITFLTKIIALTAREPGLYHCKNKHLKPFSVSGDLPFRSTKPE